MPAIIYGGPGKDDGLGGASLPKQLFPKDRNIAVEQVAAELVASLTVNRGYGTTEVTMAGPFLTATVEFTDSMPAGGGYTPGEYIESYDEVEVIGIDRVAHKVRIWYNIVSVSRAVQIRCRRQLPPEAFSVTGKLE